jgi:hypothetical protein
MQIFAALANQPSSQPQQVSNSIPAQPVQPMQQINQPTSSPQISFSPSIPFTFSAPIAGVDSIAGAIKAASTIASIFPESAQISQSSQGAGETALLWPNDLNTVSSFLANVSHFLQQISSSQTSVSSDLNAGITARPYTQDSSDGNNLAGFLNSMSNFLKNYLAVFPALRQ